MSITASYSKSPTDVLDYGIDWSDWLGLLTISTSTWDTPTGLTEVTDSHTNTVALVRLSGGTWGQRYLVTNSIVTSDAQAASRTIAINVFTPYCSASEVRAVGTQLTSTSQPTAYTDQLLDTVIERASRMFDLACGVTPGYFSAADPQGVASDQVIYGDGSNYLALPPYVPGSLNSTITLPEGYTAPEFIEKDGYLIRSSSGFLPGPVYSDWSYGWYQGMAITVNAIWGYQDTPEDVKLAVIELAINLIRETDPASLKLVSIDNQPLRESLPPRVREIARRYQTRLGVAFA